MFILYVAAVMCVFCSIFNLNMNVIWERWGLEFGGTWWAGINVDCCCWDLCFLDAQTESMNSIKMTMKVGT